MRSYRRAGDNENAPGQSGGSHREAGNGHVCKLERKVCYCCSKGKRKDLTYGHSDSKFTVNAKFLQWNLWGWLLKNDTLAIREKKLKKSGYVLCITDSLCCTPETTITHCKSTIFQFLKRSHLSSPAFPHFLSLCTFVLLSREIQSALPACLSVDFFVSAVRILFLKT